jgi:hypothetical protein
VYHDYITSASYGLCIIPLWGLNKLQLIMDAVTVTQVSEHQCIVRKIAQELAKIQILHLPQNACETI